jgi:hypothetical protein
MPIRDLLNLIDTYNRVHQNKTNVEFEMQYEPNLSDSDMFQIFRNFIVKDYEFESHNFLRLFDKDSNATCVEFMKDKSKKIYKMHKTNIVSQKTGFDSTYYDRNIFGSLKVKLKYENIINDSKIPENPEKMRLSKRYIFDGFNPMWSLQITFIKNLTSPQQIKEWKVKLFDSDCREESYFDRLQKWIKNNDITMEIELEHHQTVDATRYGWPEVELYKLFFPNNKKADYLSKLRKVYWIVHPNRVFTFKNKVKNIVNQALETNRKETSEFWSECVRNNRVQIGPKPDGLRSLAIFERKENGEFTSVIVTDVDFMTVTFSSMVEDSFKEVGTYVLDIEWFENTDTLLADSRIKIIYPIVWANEFIFKKDFQVGISLLNEHVPKSILVEFVEYTNIDNKFIKESIYQHLKDISTKKNIDYLTDGIIIRTGNTYHTHKAVKIKPHSKIDFLIRKCPDELLNKHPYVTSIVKGCTEVYMLFVGMNRKKMKDYHLKPIKGYKTLFKNISNKDYYVPYHFNVIGSDTDNHIWYSTETDEKDYDGKIAEFTYNVDTRLWTIGVSRDDKTGYGNDIATATSIWDNFHDPFTMKEIIDSATAKLGVRYDNALLTSDHIRTITGIVSTCRNKSNIIVIGTNYVCSKDTKRSHIMWPTSAMGPVPDGIIKNVHTFTRNGSKITIDKNLDWNENRAIVLPGDLSAGSFIVVLKVPEVGTDNSGIYFPIIKKRYVNIVEEAGYLITIIDVPESISNEVSEKITDPNNKLIKRAHHISLLENGDVRHIISWYKRSFSKENIEYQEIGLENPHLSKVYNYEQEENGNVDINMKNTYTRQISTDGINIRINPKNKILDSSLIENHYKSQIISIVEFLIKVDNKYVELQTILVDETIICVDGLERLFPNYKFITAATEDLKVDVVVTWKNYVEHKDEFTKHNPWYILCTLHVTDEMRQRDATISLPKSSDKYYIPYKSWNNINTAIMHINKFRENTDTYVLRAKLFVEQMIHFQYVLRPSLYKYVISEDLLRTGRFDGCYDCRSEILVLSRYLTYAKKNRDIEYCHPKTKTPEIIHIVDSLQTAYYDRTNPELVSELNDLVID